MITIIYTAQVENIAVASTKVRTALNRNGVDWYETSLADVRARIAGEY